MGMPSFSLVFRFRWRLVVSSSPCDCQNSSYRASNLPWGPIFDGRGLYSNFRLLQIVNQAYYDWILVSIWDYPHFVHLFDPPAPGPTKYINVFFIFYTNGSAIFFGILTPFFDCVYTFMGSPYVWATILLLLKSVITVKIVPRKCHLKCGA